MKRRTSRADERSKRKAAKEAGMKRPGGQSKYGRKQEWLRNATKADANLGRKLAKEQGIAYEAERKLFGFDIAEPKPWRSS